MSEQPQREWRFYVADMLSFAHHVRKYTAGFKQADFTANALVRDATLRNLELIGEAATHVPDAIRKTYPDISWRLVIATRNRLIHGYLGIDDDTLWSIIEDDVPGLIAALERLERGQGNRGGA